MVDTELMDFFDPLVDDEISKMMIRLVGENKNEENFEAILEKLIEALDGGGIND
jgi:hypothetical protein